MRFLGPTFTLKWRRRSLATLVKKKMLYLHGLPKFRCDWSFTFCEFEHSIDSIAAMRDVRPFGNYYPFFIIVTISGFNVDAFNNFLRWNKIREELVLSDFKFHDLRKTFGSVLAQNGISTAVTQKLLEHSSPDLTNKVYMNVDPILRHAVDKIPVGDWL